MQDSKNTFEGVQRAPSNVFFVSRVLIRELHNIPFLLIVVGALPGLLILFLALGEKMIVDKADTTKIIRKHFLLLLIRVKPKLICLLYHYHPT